jgi:uracil-DNA glycosylase
MPRVRRGEGPQAALDVRRARYVVEAGLQRSVEWWRRLLRRLVRLRPLATSRTPHPGLVLDWRAMDAVERAAALREYADQTAICTTCALAQGRTQVVFGSGSPNADLMFVGEAPGFHEDLQGVPFVGQAGKLLDTLLGGIGLTRADVFVANVLKCRPPGNRDPLPEEIAACEPHLFRQIELIQPKLVATLGNFATKLLSGKPAGITRVHGYEQEVTLGARTVLLFPIFHPAAALYTPSMLKVLEEDFARIPAVLERVLDEPAVAEQPDAAVEPELESVQLGLF